ncbi:cell division protein SepF [Chengkuizengella axinellae]|uniref:Cell division protein SepF n=1 Tax=Chengkuizengella axinellae TaxID=3064388 RepID=A0ABT9IV06_9BACL|nr:cell division protein SepF [Chengkuizengella sp. 2205SS18-9]MDP5273168.1 cell division protein SepF [Chengkuizengella sp. 2205SS18-9]
MGVMHKFLDFFGLQEDEEVIKKETKIEEIEDSSLSYEEEQHSNIKSTSKNNVVSIHSNKNTRVVLNEPRTYDEAQDIANHLKSRRAVIVNLQRVRSDQAKRIVDFLSGTVYALNGSISKIGSNIFLCTPDSVEIEGTITELLQDELERNG